MDRAGTGGGIHRCSAGFALRPFHSETVALPGRGAAFRGAAFRRPVAIIRNGRLTYDAGEQLCQRALRDVTILFAEPVDAGRFAALDGVRVEGSDRSVLQLSAREPAVDAVVKEAASHQVVDLVPWPADLEKVFLERYEEPGNGR